MQWWSGVDSNHHGQIFSLVHWPSLLPLQMYLEHIMYHSGTTETLTLAFRLISEFWKVIKFLLLIRAVRTPFQTRTCMWSHEESNLGLQIFSLTRASISAITGYAIAPNVRVSPHLSQRFCIERSCTKTLVKSTHRRGQSGIRTHEKSTVLQTAPLDHSSIYPN